MLVLVFFRQRNVLQSNQIPQTAANVASPQIPQMNQNYFYNPFAFVPQQGTPVAAQTGDYLSSQQIAMQAWMQQAYVQYVNQYMNM